MKRYLKLRKHTFKNIEIFLVPDGTSQSLTKASSFPINLSVVQKRVCQMLGGRYANAQPRGRDKIANAPPPGLKRSKCPTVARGGGGIGTAGID